jgi:AcrR family transcriptional regulator
MSPARNSARIDAAEPTAAEVGGVPDGLTATVPTGLAAAWGVTASAGRRGPKPAHTVEEIVTVVIDLADEEGIAAASLPKVAARVGVTANALYGYVGSKEELITLAGDVAWGNPPPLPAGGWREAAALWSRELFRRFISRSWLLDVPTTVPLTPHTAAWLDALITALEPTGMNGQDLLYCAYLLDSHARYEANLHRTALLPAAMRRRNPDQQRVIQSVRDFLDHQLRLRGLNAVAKILKDPSYLADETTSDGFEFGLSRILDGIERYVDNRQR